MKRLGLALLILLPLGVRLWALDAPLTERHQFRQSQTALTAWVFAEQGIDLLDYETPLFGPPWRVPMEFPLFQAGAALLAASGLTLEVACRGAGLLSFALALAGLAAVLRVLGASTAQRACTLLALWWMPLAVVWSRACTIEYLAAAAALFQLAALLAMNRGDRRLSVLVVALTCGSIAGLVKITTLVPYLCVAAIDLWQQRRSGRRRKPGAILLAVLVPVLVALAWTRHADGIKAASPATAWLTSAALAEWNLGTLAQRFDPAVWWTGLRRFGSQLVPFAWLGVLPGIRREPAAAAAAGGIALAWLLLTNLYVTHDYYAAAITPLAALLVGTTLPGVWQRLAARGRHLLGALLLASTVLGWAYVRPSLWQRPSPAWQLGRLAATHCAEDDWILVRGFDWDPTVLCAARRRGILLRDNVASVFTAQGWQIARDPRARVLVTTDAADPVLAVRPQAEHVASIAGAAVWVLR